MNEEWKVIERFPNYEVSNIGQIRKTSTKRVKMPEISKSGYPTIRLSIGKAGSGIHQNIHRLVAEAFLPNPGNLPCVNHIDGDKTNNHVDNLEWCSYSHNNRHAYDHGLKKAYQQRITDKDRKRIGVLRQNGVRVKDIAKMYGVGESCIYMLFRRGQIPV